MGCYYTSVPTESPSRDLVDELEWRGLIADITKPEELREHLQGGVRTAYVGFDPTADSLHVGSLLPLLALRRIQGCGHRPIVLIGGGTGLIGDPSGKAGERQLNPEEQVVAWAGRLKAQVQRFLDFDRAVLADNYEWLSSLQLISFLRDIGKHFPLGAMMARESVRSRMVRSEDGISYTEFSYQVLQAYDFMALHERHGCTLQLGGSDQWGNITAGVDLIRRVKGVPAYGITLPLVTKTDGSKFGKTESGTIWLDPRRTSPYEMYQFWLNTADEDVIPYLKYFTFLDRKEIGGLEIETRTAPERREAHRVLAREVTSLVHGEAAMSDAAAISEAIFSGDLEALTETQLDQACRTVPTTGLARSELAGVGLIDLLIRVGLAQSKREARDLLSAGAIALNGRRVSGVESGLSAEAFRFGRYLLVRKGKKTYRIATVEPAPNA
jgi:tyrosyl-tRNA synthetase